MVGSVQVRVRPVRNLLADGVKSALIADCNVLNTSAQEAGPARQLEANLKRSSDEAGCSSSTSRSRAAKRMQRSAMSGAPLLQQLNRVLLAERLHITDAGSATSSSAVSYWNLPKLSENDPARLLTPLISLVLARRAVVACQRGAAGPCVACGGKRTRPCSDNAQRLASRLRDVLWWRTRRCAEVRTCNVARDWSSGGPAAVVFMCARRLHEPSLSKMTHEPCDSMSQETRPAAQALERWRCDSSHDQSLPVLHLNDPIH